MSPDTSGSPRPERAQADSQEERRADVGNQCDGLAGRSLYGNDPHHVRHGVEKAGHIPIGQWKKGKADRAKGNLFKSIKLKINN